MLWANAAHADRMERNADRNESAMASSNIRQNRDGEQIGEMEKGKPAERRHWEC